MTTPPTPDHRRIVLVDDHAVFVESLEFALRLDGHETHSVDPNSVTTLQALLTAVQRFEPDVALIDLELGSLGNGQRLIQPLTRAHVDVVVVTSTSDRARWGECLALGARRVLSKSAPLGEVRSTIRAVGSGRPVMDQQERSALIALFREEDGERLAIRSQLEGLSPRERAVLGRLMQGQTVREIAVSFVVTEATIRTQVKAILSKLHVSSQIAAVGLAHRVGWQPPGE
jgi:DNA-binding NarL/FixJ family response regulator